MVFNEAVTGFTSSDVNLSNSTAPGTLTASVTGSGTTYEVAVSGMTGGGNVIATILAGAANDAAGNPSAAATSTDNAVAFGTTQPNLTATKTNTVGGATIVGSAWEWQIEVRNTGNADATFTSGQTLLRDDLPNTNVTYGAPSVGSVTNVTGSSNINCTITSNTLTCTASSAAVTLGADGSFRVTVSATSSTAGTFANPRSGGVCAVDPDQVVGMSDSCADSVTVTAQLVPDLTISKSHSGSFNQGQTGAQYTLQVTNNGSGPTSGLVTVVDTLPAGLTATAMAGSGWNCDLGTLTCTRSDALAASSSYPNLILTVNVASNAPASLVNSAEVTGGGESNTSNNIANDPTTVNPTQPPSTAMIVISSDSNGSVPGLSFRDEDIMAYNSATQQWSLVFDGSDVGLGNVDVDAFAFLPNGHLLLSVDKDFKLNGFGQVDESDILKFIPTSLGNTTSGSYAIYFDGSAVGLDKSNEDVDAIDFDASGNLLISVDGAFKAQNVSGADEDLFVLNGFTPGANTTGTWALYFDGSDVGLTSSGEDLFGLWADHAHSKLYLSTRDNFSVPGASGDKDDIFVCQYTTLGNNTACTFTSFWNGDAAGFGVGAIDGLALGEPPMVVNAAESSGSLVIDDTDEYAGDDANEPNPRDGEEIAGQEVQSNHVFLPFTKR